MKASIAPLAIALVYLVGCGSRQDSPADARGGTPSPSCVVEPAAAIEVLRLRSPRRVEVDGVLGDWTSELKVVEIKAAQHWGTRQDPVPQSTRARGSLMSIFMAHDDDYWYLGVDVTDEKVVAGLPEYPYSGDCFELFFAGTQVDSGRDIHALIDPGPGRRAFLQLQIPQRPLKALVEHFSTWRTDPALTQRAIQDGVMVSSSTDQHQWRAELRIPFKSFDDEVLDRIGKRQPTKLGFDYLNYNNHIVRERTADNRWGFDPDEVYADAREENVNVPRCMRPLHFQQ